MKKILKKYSKHNKAIIFGTIALFMIAFLIEEAPSILINEYRKLRYKD